VATGTGGVKVNCVNLTFLTLQSNINTATALFPLRP